MRIDSAEYTKGKDIVILQFPFDKYDLDEMRQIFDSTQKAFPDNILLALPEDISLSLLREDNPFL